MSIIETKVLRVENSEDVINATGNELACFGWTVTNVQVTHSQNSKTYSSAWDQLGGNQTQTVETTTVNYATITLQRDKGMNNYREICALEGQYNSVVGLIAQKNEEYTKKTDRMGCLAIIFWPLLIFKFLFGDRKLEAYANEIEQLNKKKKAILAQASELL